MHSIRDLRETSIEPFMHELRKSLHLPPEQYEQGRADERINVNDLLVPIEMVLRDALFSPRHRATPFNLDEIKRVLKLVRDYRAQTEKIKQLGREKGWYPR